jgi:hypothetical protein
MNTDVTTVAKRMYELLPAVYRLRDAETGYPLRELIAVIAEQVAVVQEGLEQSYDNLFIETCAEWVIPYIGDLIGARPLHGKAPGAAAGRAEVADTLGLRRRKGTLAALEQTARAVTGYPAVAVEFFQRLAVTQYMNHVRPENHYTVDMRDELALERISGPFERAAHTLEVRRISSGRGRYNIQNIGIYLFRLRSLALSGVSAARIDDFRYTFNPLAIDAPLFNNPRTELAITEFAAPEHVPMPISRLAMNRDKAGFYGPNGALLLQVNGTVVPESDVQVCNLSDAIDGSGAWAHAPADHYGVDPVLGRIAAPSGRAAPTSVVVSYRYGFSDTIGGGAYERGEEIAGTASQVVSEAAPDLQAALDAVAGGGIVEFADSRTYALASAAPNLDVAASQEVELRAANGQRPTIRMSGGELVINGGDNATIALNGLVLVGGALRITGAPESVTLRHCTLVPGIERTRQNEPAELGAPSLIVEPDGVEVMIDRCITGSLCVANGSAAKINRSIVDAEDATLPAFEGFGAAGGTLTIQNSTVIGRVHAQQIELASNTIFVASAASASDLPVRSERTQDGCMRFSVVPPDSRTPRRYRCVALLASFTSLRFGTPGYCQLGIACDESIRRGADDESEIGVFHDLFQPQRESDLRTRLDEFLRFGMEAGIFYAT